MAIQRSIKTRIKAILNNIFSVNKKAHGNIFSANVGSTATQANVSGNKYVVLAVRVSAGNLDKILDVFAGSGMSTTNDDFLLEVWKNPTVAGAAFTWTAINNSFAEYAVGVVANTVNAATGSLMFSCYGRQLSFKEFIIERPEGIVEGDEIIMTVEPLSNQLDFYGGFNWDEHKK